jgi:hypothetical protein
LVYIDWHASTFIDGAYMHVAVIDVPAILTLTISATGEDGHHL